MKLAISNIAWPHEADGRVAGLLHELGIAGVEIAPTMVWRDPLRVPPEEVAVCRDFWERRGQRIIALQALLFGRPDLTIFDTEAARQRTFDHLCGMIGLAAALGASVLVFGSPTNRSVRSRAPAAAFDIARTFFGALATEAARHNTVFCLEPNPPEYRCDFLTTSEEALRLIRAVDQPGLGLHLDAGALTLSREPCSAITAAAPWVRHFHVSEPHLAPVGANGVDHRAFGDALAGAGYAGWLSIEMRPPEGDMLPGLERALTTAFRQYAALEGGPHE